MMVAVLVGGPARAHEHMFIAADATGTLMLQYDFARKFPVTLLAPGVWIGDDPSFSPLLADNPAAGLFRLADGKRVILEILSIDAALSVELNGKTLDRARDTGGIGTMPYLHVHPTWRLAPAGGTIGDFPISFRIRASGYTTSPVYNAMVSNVPTTTSTTATSTTSTSTTASTSTTTTLPIVVELLTGRSFAFAVKAGTPERSTLALQSRDPALAVDAAADPTLLGATLRVRATSSGIDLTLPLPAQGWQLAGRDPGWTYRDPQRLAGPVSGVVLKAGKLLKIGAKGAALATALAASPDPVDVTLSIGLYRYCLRFGGGAKFQAGKSFKASDAPAPAACAP